MGQTLANKDNAPEPIIEVTDLQKYFGSLHVLKGISTKIFRGEVVAMIGPSGSGKSTFLRCLNRLEEPTTGSIKIDGTEIVDHRIDINKIRTEIGMVFQDYNLFPHLNVIQNITLAPVNVRRMKYKEAEEIGMKLLKRVGVADKADQYPSNLSGGQQQRVAIARSLAMQPKIMFFDEPTSALDPEMIREVLDVMRNLAESGMTMVVVSHELGFIREASNKILVLDDGLVIEEGTPDKIFNHAENKRTQGFLSMIL
ncbi:MAG: amino acid ABC transporter ATP-binding protein [Sediminispirochaetaceae bacterium]